MKNLLIISGISGSGKTTLAKYFVEHEQGWLFMDIDSYYLKDKPKAELSNGQIVSNWDCLNAIDWESYRKDLRGALAVSNVVLSTFVTFPGLLQGVKCLYSHVKLISGDTAEQIKARCIAARRLSKPLTDPERDRLIVEELVYPFYWSQFYSLKADLKVYTYHNETDRTSVEDLYKFVAGNVLKAVEYWHEK